MTQVQTNMGKKTPANWVAYFCSESKHQNLSTWRPFLNLIYNFIYFLVSMFRDMSCKHFFFKDIQVWSFQNPVIYTCDQNVKRLKSKLDDIIRIKVLKNWWGRKTIGWFPTHYSQTNTFLKRTTLSPSTLCSLARASSCTIPNSISSTPCAASRKALAPSDSLSL